MRNVSIYGKKWLDLVFEGKNKEYGAYKLRQEQNKTTTIAFIFGMTFLCGFVFLLSSFTKPEPVTISCDEPKITPIHLIENPIIDEPKVEPLKPKSNPKTPIEIEKPTGQMFIVKTPAAIVDVPTNAELPTNPTPPTGIPTGGTEPYVAPTTGGGNVPTILPAKPTGPIPTSELDRQPNYPGGMKNFYEYVGTNFDRNNLDEGETIRVKVSFVIEKNGTMTDIKVLEKTNNTIDNEAIRVLKSLRTKWSPGFKNGEPVRTQFTLPITVVL